MKRLWQLDALRGLMLVMMILTHMPTRIAPITSQLFGYVSAAEGFVLLSALMAALVYGKRGLSIGMPMMRKSLWERSKFIYLCHLVSLLFAYTVIVWLIAEFEQQAAWGVVRFYLENPITAGIASLFLIYSPPLLDILPMYIIFMVITPWILERGFNKGWKGIFAISLLLWFLAQFKFGQLVYRFLAGAVGFDIPYSGTGAFSFLAWQLIWLLGLWMGAQLAQENKQAFTMPNWAIISAVIIAFIFFLWRHIIGETPFFAGSFYNLWLDKWSLGPLRMLNVFALLIIILQWGEVFSKRIPRPKRLIALGSSSLQVFCAHLLVVLLTLAIVGGSKKDRPWSFEFLLLAICFGFLLLVARITLLWRKYKKQRLENRQNHQQSN